jgi:hypothetical protein
MPITFGSVGDIISVCLLIKDLVIALDECRGSAKEYQHLMQDLRNLERVLLELDLLNKSCNDNADFVALGETAKRTSAECRALIEPFYDRIFKYNEYLKSNHDKRMLVDKYWKIHWKITQKDYVAQFRTALHGRVAAITLLLVTASV